MALLSTQVIRRVVIEFILVREVCQGVIFFHGVRVIKWLMCVWEKEWSWWKYEYSLLFSAGREQKRSDFERLIESKRRWFNQCDNWRQIRYLKKVNFTRMKVFECWKFEFDEIAYLNNVRVLHAFVEMTRWTMIFCRLVLLLDTEPTEITKIRFQIES